MGKRLGVLAAVAIAGLLALAIGAMPAARAQPASPSLVFCGANATAADATVLALGLGGALLPAPTDGIVTGWRVMGGDTEGRLEQRLQVFRRVDGAVNSFLAVAESSPRIAPNGPRALFKTRIPVESGDLFALRGTVETFVCRGLVGVTSGLHEGPTPVGASHEFKAEEGLGVPLGVVVEPDEDGDGYGDRTQDRCTRAATTQDGCPAVKLLVKNVTARSRSIVLRATVATEAEVGVLGTVEWPFRNPERGIEGIVVSAVNSGTKTLRPGRLGGFRVKLPDPVLQELGSLAPEKALKAKVIVRATSLAGRSVERELTVRLPGQKRS